ncbi:Monofunctional biosynthetic peptidoglycan transglycosylase [Desulfamplus magnetovallimortis]|uniref:Biosynthetic peptidoglycan transglycosylase n=1 Tax=Desulfamplus magnetovallimortis TaxID=1246637 RepID=A0A1W1HC03_9BACT|nr:monofunctional biosynthetic peptidoglycan transglycosylase [Desulfamplus magnetovallimortis]SLM29915.1 Monofunctional biosynthetic peptidoglycan transglycosylase [Desulfamplus magnetovallimortis]
MKRLSGFKTALKNMSRIVGKKILKILIVLFVLFGCVSTLQVVLVRYINPPVTFPMVWEWVIKKSTGRPYTPFIYEWRDFDQISSHLKKAVMAAEDQRFLSHNGFDFIELRRIFDEFIKEGRIRGGSTITMQAARSIYLIPCRNIVRKAFEAWYTILMEFFWDKKRIFELYLNCVDWGDAVIGAEAASQRYYGVSSGKLNPSQAAMMAGILPAPHRLSPKKPDSYLLSRQKRILKDMKLMPEY